MHVRIILASVAISLMVASPVQAQDRRMANYFFCSLVEGQTPADLMAFKAEYEKSVEKAGLDGYQLRVQFPLFFEDVRPGRFIWDGSWTDLTEMARITAWFEASEWPARFPKMMSCDSNSLWQVVD